MYFYQILTISRSEELHIVEKAFYFVRSWFIHDEIELTRGFKWILML